MKKRNERKGGNDFSFSYQSEFVFCHKPLNHEDSGTWDGRAIEQAHALKLRACFTVLLFVFSLVVLYLWFVSNSCYFYSFFIFTILIFLQSWIWYSFCQSFCSVFSFSISRDTCISICLGHYQTFSTKSNKITERLMSPLTVTVKPMSLQTLERHFSFLFFLVVKECVWLDSTKGIAEKEWNNTKKFVHKAW